MSGLRSLLQLTKIYCEKFQVKLVGCKTTLLVFTTRNTEIIAKIELVDTPITVKLMGLLSTPLNRPHMLVSYGLSMEMGQTLLPGCLLTVEQCMVFSMLGVELN